MYNKKMDRLSEKGRQAKTTGELLDVQIEIANLISEGLADLAMPVSEISAAPVVMILEQYAQAIRSAVSGMELDEQIALLRGMTNTSEYIIPFE